MIDLEDQLGSLLGSKILKGHVFDQGLELLVAY